MKNKYDIFISYRRTAYDTAYLIAEKLRHAGYRVFFDVDTLTSGKFNEQLLQVISDCKDFVLVLPENALERCHDDGDWIRREVMCAISTRKNIIPIMLDGFFWPKEMPKGMEELPNYQAVTAVNREYFDMSYSRLTGYLNSKPAKPLKKWFTKAAIILSVILVLTGIGYGVLNHVANVTCEEIATKQTSVMEAVDLLHDISKELEEQTTPFFSAMVKNQDEEKREHIRNDFLKVLDKQEREMKSLQKTIPAPEFNMGSIETFALSSYDIKPVELNEFSSYYSTLYEDVNNVINLFRDLIELDDYSVYNKVLISMHFGYITHSVNGFYYSYLANMSLLPKSARKVYYDTAKKWKHYPNGTPLDLSQDEYEKFQLIEMAKANEVVEKMEKYINYEDSELDELEDKMDSLLQEVRDN